MNSNGILAGILGAAGGARTQSNGTASVNQSNVLLFQGATTSLGAATQTITQTQIKNPNGLPMHNMYIQLTVTDTTGASSAPSGVNSIETALTLFTITGQSGRQLMNIIPNANDKFRRLQHRFNTNGYYNTPPTPADSSTSTAYSVSYNVLLGNWVIDPSEFPLTVQYTYNTLSSRATTLNSMTSTASVTAYGDFVKLASAMPRSVVRVKPVTGITATNYDFSTYLDAAPILDVSLDVGSADTAIASGTGAINIAVNNNSLVPNTGYQTVINQEDRLYNISTPHITGYFPFNVLNGMQVLNPATQKDTLQVNFASAPNCVTSGEADLIMVEAY